MAEASSSAHEQKAKQLAVELEAAIQQKAEENPQVRSFTFDCPG